MAESSSGRVVQQPAGFVQQLEPLVLLAFADVGAIGDEDDRRSGTASRTIERGSIHRTMTASSREAGVGHRDHLAEPEHLGQLAGLRRAARQRDRGGHEDGPERRSSRAAARNAASHSRGPGRRRRRRRSRWKIDQRDHRGQGELGEVERALDAGLLAIGEQRAARSRRGRASRYSSGGRKNSPTTPGSSLSENEWRSRRKWTSTTFDLAEVEAKRRERPRDA